VTVIECICADGTSITPLIIFKGGSIDSKWVPSITPANWRISASINGWTSHLHGIEWLRYVFDRATRNKANGRPRVLICDGHDSHVTGDFIEFCKENNIKLLLLPPHTSHIRSGPQG